MLTIPFLYKILYKGLLPCIPFEKTYEKFKA